MNNFSRNPMTAMRGVETLVGAFQTAMDNIARRPRGYAYDTTVSLAAYEHLEGQYHELYATAVDALDAARVELARKDSELVFLRALLKRVQNR